MTVMLVHVPPSLADDLERHRLGDAIGREHIVDKLHDALARIRG